MSKQTSTSNQKLCQSVNKSLFSRRRALLHLPSPCLPSLPPLPCHPPVGDEVTVRTTGGEPLNLQLQFSPRPSLGGRPSGRSADWYRLHTRPLSYGAPIWQECPMHSLMLLHLGAQLLLSSDCRERQRGKDTHKYTHKTHTITTHKTQRRIRWASRQDPHA